MGKPRMVAVHRAVARVFSFSFCHFNLSVEIIQSAFLHLENSFGELWCSAISAQDWAPQKNFAKIQRISCWILVMHASNAEAISKFVCWWLCDCLITGYNSNLEQSTGIFLWRERFSNKLKTSNIYDWATNISQLFHHYFPLTYFVIPLLFPNYFPVIYL